MSNSVDTVEDFVAHYGCTPQEYFSKVVLNDAAQPRLAEFEKGLAAAQKAFDALKGAPGSGDPEKMADWAYQGNLVDSYSQLVNSAKYHQKWAKAFLAGEIASYGPYLGAEGQRIKKAGWIDPTIVP